MCVCVCREPTPIDEEDEVVFGPPEAVEVIEMGREVREEEGVRPKVRKAPPMPSHKEAEEPMAAHIPFRDWCAHFMQGKSTSNPQKSLFLLWLRAIQKFATTNECLPRINNQLVHSYSF